MVGRVRRVRVAGAEPLPFDVRPQVHVVALRVDHIEPHAQLLQALRSLESTVEMRQEALGDPIGGLGIAPAEVHVDDIPREVVRKQPVGTAFDERQMSQPFEQVVHVVLAERCREERFGQGARGHAGVQRQAMLAARHLLDELLDQQTHDLGFRVEPRRSQPVASCQHIGREREGERVPAGERQRFLMLLDGHTASCQVRPALVGAEVAQGMDTCQRAPVQVRAPGGLGFVASRDDDQTAGRELREHRVAEPLVDRRQPLVGVDEQHAASRPPFEHRTQVAVGGAEGLAQGDEESQRRGFDVAAIDAHHVAAGLVGHPRVLVEERRLSNPAGSRDVQRHEGRVAGLQRRPEDRDLLLAPDEPLAAGRREPFGNPGKVGGRAVLRLALCRSGRRWRSGGAGRGDRRDEPVPPLGNRFDVARIPLVVAERTTQVGNRTGQRRLGDEAAFPDRLDDLVLRDDAAGAAGQKHQQIHHLWLETTHRLVVADEVAGGLREPPADVDVRSGRRTSLPTGHPRIVDVLARSAPSSASGGAGRRRQRAQLPQRPEIVARGPALDDLAVREAEDLDRRRADALAGRRACPGSRPCRSPSRCSG